jgi:predicted RNA polymerase sigma factor
VPGPVVLLLALMLFHSARQASRVDDRGDLALAGTGPERRFLNARLAEARSQLS